MPAPKTLYLTFDDGPDPIGTPRVLEVLRRHGVSATFFVIAQQASTHPVLLKQIQGEGHSIGNHSLDHGYRNFFLGKAALKKWIVQAETELASLIGGPTIGFRPPAGVRTPELFRALKELNTPLILWDQRFFDTTFVWTASRARRSLNRIHSDSVILLHDRQHPKKLETFLTTLEFYIVEAKSRGFEFKHLTSHLRPKG